MSISGWSCSFLVCLGKETVYLTQLGTISLLNTPSVRVRHTKRIICSKSIPGERQLPTNIIFVLKVFALLTAISVESLSAEPCPFIHIHTENVHAVDVGSRGRTEYLIDSILAVFRDIKIPSS